MYLLGCQTGMGVFSKILNIWETFLQKKKKEKLHCIFQIVHLSVIFRNQINIVVSDMLNYQVQTETEFFLEHCVCKYSQIWPYSHLYQAVTCIKRSPFSFFRLSPIFVFIGTKKKWPYKTGGLLKEVQLI
jgi:hypothetical protein